MHRRLITLAWIGALAIIGLFCLIPPVYHGPLTLIFAGYVSSAIAVVPRLISRLCDQERKRGRSGFKRRIATFLANLDTSSGD